MKQIDECREILADPYEYIRRFKAESQRKVVGTFCSYAPEEIILAAGGHPFRIFGSGEKIRLADAHLQSYCCSLVRGAREDALAGRLVGEGRAVVEWVGDMPVYAEPRPKSDAPAKAP